MFGTLVFRVGAVPTVLLWVLVIIAIYCGIAELISVEGESRVIYNVCSI